MLPGLPASFLLQAASAIEGSERVWLNASMPPRPVVELMRGESPGHIRVFGGPDAEAAIGAMRMVLRGAQEGRFSHEPATATSPETWGVHFRCRGALQCLPICLLLLGLEPSVRYIFASMVLTKCRWHAFARR